MPYAGQQIASEIKAALIEAAEATGQPGGLTGTLIRPNPSPDPNAYPPVPAPPPTEYPITCLWGQFDRTEAAAGLVDGVTAKLLVAPDGLPVAPDTGDSVRIQGVTYAITGKGSLQPGGTPLLYTVYLRNSGGA